MIAENGMQHNGVSARERWVYNIRAGLTVLFFVLLPWQTRWIYRASPIHPDAEWGRLSLYASELLLGVFLVWALVRWVMLWRRGAVRRQPFTRERWWLVGALAVLLYGVLRSVLNYDSAAGFQHTWWLMEAVLIAVFLRTGWFPRRAAIHGFLIGMTIAAVLGIGQVVFQYAPAQKWLGLAEHISAQGGASVVETGSTRFLRSYGPFPHPNIFGGYLVFVLLVILSDPDKVGGVEGSHRDEIPRFARNDIIRFFLTILFTVALALTFSRSAWIAWLVVLATVFYQERRHVMAQIFVSVITMLAVLAMLWPVTHTRFNTVARLEARAIDERIIGIADGIALWKRAPWFGYGPAQYVNTFFTQHPGMPWWQLALPHNVWLALLVEYGLVGGLLVVGVVLLFLWSLRSVRSFVWLLPLITLALFDHYLWSLYSGILLFALFAGFCAPSIHSYGTHSTQQAS